MGQDGSPPEAIVLLPMVTFKILRPKSANSGLTPHASPCQMSHRHWVKESLDELPPAPQGIGPRCVLACGDPISKEQESYRRESRML